MNLWSQVFLIVLFFYLDIYGLLLFLGVDPYCHQKWWKALLYEPYKNGQRQPLCDVLAKIMWRSAKKDVIHEVQTGRIWKFCAEHQGSGLAIALLFLIVKSNKNSHKQLFEIREKHQNKLGCGWGARKGWSLGWLLLKRMWKRMLGVRKAFSEFYVSSISCRHTVYLHYLLSYKALFNAS